MFTCLFQGHCSQHAGGCTPPLRNHSCHSPLCLVVLAVIWWPFRCQRKENTSSCPLCITKHDRSLKFLHLFIMSLSRLLPVFWLSALVDVLLSSSSLHWSENCLALEIQVSFSAAFHHFSNLEWKSSLLGNTFLLTCVFVILPLPSAWGASFLVNTNLCYNKVITNPTKTAYLKEFFICSKWFTGHSWSGWCVCSHALGTACCTWMLHWLVHSILLDEVLLPNPCS